MSVVSQFRNELLSIPGWRSNRKIVVIESDDWGSIRMSSKASFGRLNKAGLDLGPSNSLRFNQYDTLASAKDLEALFEVLRKHTDQHHRHPIITALSLTANPDFEKIRKQNFESYYYECFTETLEKYYPNQLVWALWQQGIEEKFFSPQFHGREHLNVYHWLSALRANDSQTHLAFKEGVCGFNNPHPFGISYQAAFDFVEPAELEAQKEILKDGLNQFEKLFGYRASFFVPPNGILNEHLYADTAVLGIKYQYSSRKHLVPLGAGKYKTRFNYLGKKNAASQCFITRNAFFEPSLTGKDWVSSCFREIETAFRWGKPAIISSHRVNFIGALEESNRTNGLKHFDDLLTRIKQRWPTVEYMTTPELGLLITGDNN
jgi:hypothetical protein